MVQVAIWVLCRDLPVQVEAVNAFREFVEQLADAGQLEAKLQPILKDLLLHFFEMASLVEAMDVIMSVDAIISHVGDSIQPYAVECCREVRFARFGNGGENLLSIKKRFFN